MSICGTKNRKPAPPSAAAAKARWPPIWRNALGFAFLPVTVLAAAGSFWALPFALLPVGILGALYLGRRHEA